ncbi:hypothetical protein [Nonomuraea sp. NPDC001023]|uniref:hypothetical protein n=1 Tax=unclassified Nonomuraea TaxID=2593643 RepID=UPI0033255613
MISSQHEALHRVFRDNPELCTSVFTVLDIPFPSPTEVAVADTDLTEIKPIERRADTIMMFTSLRDGTWSSASRSPSPTTARPRPGRTTSATCTSSSAAR